MVAQRAVLSSPGPAPGRRARAHGAIPCLVLLLGLTAGCAHGRTAAQSACYTDAVQTSPGLFLPMASSRFFQVYPTDNHISMNWRPLDQVRICPIGGGAVEITNVTEKGAHVKAMQVYNLD